MSDPSSDDTAINISKDKLLEWLETKNRTFGWDALAAYDRATINAAFREQYLRRYTGGGRLPVITGSEPVGDRVYRFFENISLGSILVSFEESSIEKTAPVARVTLPVVGGRETQYEYAGGSFVTCKRINEITALNEPNITGLINFMPLQQIGHVGVIALDLADGTYQANFGETIWDPGENSSLLKEEFTKWDKADRQWIVSRVQRNIGELAIQSFALRTQRKVPSASRSEVGYGEGAVVAFLKMDDPFETSTWPVRETDVAYLVPDDSADEYTATIILQDARLLLACLKAYFVGTSDVWAVLMPPPAPFAARVNRANAYTRLEVTEGILNVYNKDWISRELQQSRYPVVALEGATVPLAANGPKVSIEVEGRDTSSRFDDVFMIRVQVPSIVVNLETWYNDGNPNSGLLRCQIKISGAVAIRYKLQLNVVTQQIEANVVSVAVYEVDASEYNYKSNILSWRDTKPIVLDLTGKIFERMAGKVRVETGLETVPLRSLLLDWPFETRLSQAALRQDMAMFGHIAPGSADFTVTNQFPVLAAGSTHDFAISKPGSGVTWSVRNLPGETHYPGSISSTGRYTAPTLAQLSGSQVQVVVQAVVGLTRASALVTTVRRSLELNPLIQFTKIQSRSDTKISFGSLSNTPAVWTGPAAEDGTLQLIPGEPNARLFIPPETAIANALVRVVPISVTVGSLTECVFVAVLHNLLPIFQPLASQFDSANRTVQLSLENDPPGITWEVVAGSATIASNGLLTADADPLLPFALVVATYQAPIPGLPPYWGYILLALPLVSFPPEPPAPEDSNLLVCIG
ncbi:MAG: hypothetical protein ACRYF9_14985 [Janthinobacterium lividum]